MNIKDFAPIKGFVCRTLKRKNNYINYYKVERVS